MSKEYKNPVCRGCWTLGNNCKTCERCVETRPHKQVTQALCDQPTSFPKPPQSDEEAAKAWADQWHMRKLASGDNNPVWACEVNAFLAGAQHVRATEVETIGKKLNLEKELTTYLRKMDRAQQEEVASLRSQLAEAAKIVARKDREISALNQKLITAQCKVATLREALEKIIGELERGEY